MSESSAEKILLDETSPKKIAIITGASQGLGKYFFERLYSYGYLVIGTTSKRTASEANLPLGLEEHGALVYLDFNKIDSVKRLIDLIGKTSKQVKILINNASYQGPRESLFPNDILSKDYLSEWLQCVTVTNWGMSVLCDKIGLVMMRDAPGQILNVGAASATYGQSLNIPVLCTKRSVETITAHYAKKYREKISVNCLAPGFVETETLLKRRALFPKLFEDYDEQNKMNAYLKLDDFESILSFLQKNEISGVTGETIVIDGGRFSDPT